MNYKLFAIIFLILGIIFCFGSFTGSMTYPDKTNQLSCEMTDMVNGSDCGVWDDDTCYRGTIQNGSCMRNKKITVYLLPIGIVSIVLSVVFFILNKKK